MSWGGHSALDPAGPLAARLAGLFWSFFGVTAVVYLLVMIVIVIALVRRGAPEPRRVRHVITAAGVVTALVLVGLLVTSVHAGRGINPNAGGGSLTVRVIAHQWWWELQYEGSPPSQWVTTANELHLPVGQPVLLRLISRDVIHSFWVPALHGKRDLIPGHESTTYVQADRVGVYEGACAEFCGDQHAHMRLLVVAEPEAEFQRWLGQQRKLPPPPADALARRGQDVFVRGPCALCHTVLGTTAGATMGPDLTHFAGRRTLGAAARPNTRGHLAGWILDSQSVKPGNRMPVMALAGPDLQALLAYLETLK